MKKYLSILLTLVMVLSMAACGTSPAKEPVNNAGSPTSTNVQSKETNSSAPYTVKMIMPYILTAPGADAVQATEDAINNYMANELGITDMVLDLQVTNISEEMTTTPLSLAGSEKIDIVSVHVSQFPTYVANGYLYPLNEFLDDELAGAKEKVEEFLVCTLQNGNYYALPSWSAQVTDWKFIYNKDMVDAVCDMSEVDTFDEVLEVLEKLKEAYPEEHFLAYPNQIVDILALEDHTSAVGTYAATVGDDTTLVNYYATDAYRRGVEKAYYLHSNGFTDPEGSTNTQGHDALVYTGSSKGVLMGHSLTNKTVEEMFNGNNTYGATFDSVSFALSDMVNARFNYGISYTSENPSAAARMLNLIWTDEFIFNTLGFGVEGVDYVWNEDHTGIEYPEGFGQMTVPYNCIYALAGIGDQRMTWEIPGGTSKEDLKFITEITEKAWFPPTYGFTPDSTNVSTQVAAVSNVVSQYNDVLTYGDVDPAEYLPKFLEELDAAGIGDIIAEYQSQLDAWLAENN